MQTLQPVRMDRIDVPARINDCREKLGTRNVLFVRGANKRRKQMHRVSLVEISAVYIQLLGHDQPIRKKINRSNPVPPAEAGRSGHILSAKERLVGRESACRRVANRWSPELQTTVKPSIVQSHHKLRVLGGPENSHGPFRQETARLRMLVNKASYCIVAENRGTRPILEPYPTTGLRVQIKIPCQVKHSLQTAFT